MKLFKSSNPISGFVKSLSSIHYGGLVSTGHYSIKKPKSKKK